MSTETTSPSGSSDYSEGGRRRRSFTKAADMAPVTVKDTADVSSPTVTSVQEPAPAAPQPEPKVSEAAPKVVTSAVVDNDPFRGKGGSYYIDPKTGKRLRA